MTTSVSAPGDDELAIDDADRACVEVLPHGPISGGRESLTRDRVIAEIIRAICRFRTSFDERDIDGDTNLGLDLGFESASRIELLLEVEDALDVVLDFGPAVMFDDLTVAQVADLIVALPDVSMDGYR